MNPSMDAAERARQSAGSSNSLRLYEVVQGLVRCHGQKGLLVDVGCGQGNLFPLVEPLCERYVGVDIVRYEHFPRHARAEFAPLNLDAGRAALPDASCEVVCCLETIEHVENPRALMRELTRLLKPGGLLVVTTPNQLSWLSKLCFILKNEHVHFQERPGLYPAHLSALLAVDLLRMARENGLADAQIHYSGEGRVPGVGSLWPRWLCAEEGWRGRAFSDNVVLSARKPGAVVAA